MLEETKAEIPIGFSRRMRFIIRSHATQLTESKMFKPILNSVRKPALISVQFNNALAWKSVRFGAEIGKTTDIDIVSFNIDGASPPHVVKHTLSKPVVAFGPRLI